MNHQHFSGLLIGRGMSRLSERERLEFQGHLSSCGDCAQDWELHSRLVVQPVPPMPLTLEARCRAAFAERHRPGGGNRKSRLYFLIGTALVIAAAAAMLAMHLARLPQRLSLGPASPVITQPPSVEPKVEMRAPVESGISAVKAGEQRETDAVPVLQGPVVMVMLPVHETRNQARQAVVHNQYLTVIRKLSQQPDLTLIQPDTGGQTADARPYYRITLTSREPSVKDSSAGRWQIELRIALLGKEGNVRDVSVGNYEGVIDSPCMVEIPVGSPCPMDAGEIALADLEGARLLGVPPDPFLLRKLRTQLLDATLPFSIRFSSFTKLRTANQHSSDWDGTSILAAVNLVGEARDPRIRAEVWRMLRGIRHPDLVVPLVKLLDKEEDEEVRRAAATTLSDDFAGDPVAREALRTLAMRDSQSVVQMQAARALYGAGSWHKYALDALKDSSLTDSARVEPLLLRMAQNIDPSDKAAFLENEEVLVQLTQLLPRIWSKPREMSESAPSMTFLLGALADVKHPAAMGILLEALRKSNPGTRATVARYVLGGRLDNPSVRRALEDAAANDPDSGVRRAAELALKRKLDPNQ